MADDIFEIFNSIKPGHRLYMGNDKAYGVALDIISMNQMIQRGDKPLDYCKNTLEYFQSKYPDMKDSTDLMKVHDHIKNDPDLINLWVLETGPESTRQYYRDRNM